MRPGSSAAPRRPIRHISLAHLQKVSGGYIGGDPPVPIPNTAVKPSRADGTARFPCGRVGRCRNFFPDAPPRHHAPRGVALSALQVNRRTRRARRGGNVVSVISFWGLGAASDRRSNSERPSFGDPWDESRGNRTPCAGLPNSIFSDTHGLRGPQQLVPEIPERVAPANPPCLLETSVPNQDRVTAKRDGILIREGFS